MPARKVDIVFCLDTSDSMQPCIDSVRENIGRLIDQLKDAKFEWRLDFVAHHMPGRRVYHTETLNGNACDLLYGNDPESHFFTTDIERFKQALGQQKVAGDENMLCALDFALDMPFGPANTTQRVVVLISDEPFETNEPEAFEKALGKVDAIMEKIRARHITFLAVMPVRDGGIAEKLSMVDRADIIPVEENDQGMQNVDMADLLGQLGKTISVTTMQSSGEEPYKRALFGQDKWPTVKDFDHIGDKK